MPKPENLRRIEYQPDLKDMAEYNMLLNYVKLSLLASKTGVFFNDYFAKSDPESKKTNKQDLHSKGFLSITAFFLFRFVSSFRF